MINKVTLHCTNSVTSVVITDLDVLPMRRRRNDGQLRAGNCFTSVDYVFLEIVSDIGKAADVPKINLFKLLEMQQEALQYSVASKYFEFVDQQAAANTDLKSMDQAAREKAVTQRTEASEATKIKSDGGAKLRACLEAAQKELPLFAHLLLPEEKKKKREKKLKAAKACLQTVLAGVSALWSDSSCQEYDDPNMAFGSLSQKLSEELVNLGLDDAELKYGAFRVNVGHPPFADLSGPLAYLPALSF